MRTLFIMRHGKSSHDSESGNDHDRPLDQQGRNEAARIGKLLLARNAAPHAFIASTAVRARDTAKLVIKATNQKVDPDLKAELYMADTPTFVNVIAKVQTDLDSLMVVGHCPGLEAIVAHLTGKSRNLPTGALAQIELPIGHWKELTMKTRGELVNLWFPKDLD
ncbi:MAG: 2,3-bisphosphoglycerate-dependent phosphoglycerate mutase [Planctomycetota bacterium]|jgi:phosphohistidine phosphatase